MYDLVILYSGGLDSRLMLEMARDLNLKPYCIMIDYEQLHLDELKFAKSHLEKLMIDNQTIKIRDLNIDSGLTGSGKKDETTKVHSMHVPGRNSIFLSLAFSIAENKNIDLIWIGPDDDDFRNKFPDCTQQYIMAMDNAFKYAGPKPIKIEAPLLGLSKQNILNLLKNKGIEEHEIYSGYGDL